ncbi:MAG: RidA family protein [Erythrobacter sp.]|nr:RidA family protein [Sphingomonas sp.]NNC60103.1 RidA family protein [Erythrobacter sp.]RZV34528.1 MAG: RidA family protein [Sphingomonadaceae bacterium]
MHQTIHPAGWAPAIGYANGVAASGRTLYLGGQIGWNAKQQFESDDLVDQVKQTLENIVAVVEEAGGKPEHIVSMTWYMTDLEDYVAHLKDVGRAYRAVIGKHFPAMAVVEVTRLVERQAKVEIQAIAVLPA